MPVIVLFFMYLLFASVSFSREVHTVSDGSGSFVQVMVIVFLRDLLTNLKTITNKFWGEKLGPETRVNIYCKRATVKSVSVCVCVF